MKTRTGKSPSHPLTAHPSRWLRVSIALALGLAVSGVLPSYADDLPTGGDIIHGGGSITTDGPNMNIDTTGGRTVINWDNFSIGPDNKVHFQQPDGSSITLNRVIGNHKSEIFGVLTSNGKLILVNPNGIWFGKNARISTSSLLAAAGALSDEQIEKFKQGEKFDIDLKGLVRNDGSIQLIPGADGNNALGDKGTVALLGAQVENHGVIQARKGSVVMATGPKATLDFTGDGLLSLAISGEPATNTVNADVQGGVSNSGHIDVGNGIVAMSAARAASHLDSVINLGGAVVADSVTEQGGHVYLGNAEQTRVTGTVSAKGTDGGRITVLGDNVTVAGGAKLDASGTTGKGGQVLVGGSFQGQGSEPAAKSTAVEKGAELKADGAKEGGLVVAWSDGQTRFAGSASAKGGDKGGTVETSGKQLQVTADAKVDTSGKEHGTWLLDPDNITVAEPGSSTIPGNSDTGDWTVSPTAIVMGLANGNVRLLANNQIHINAPIVATNIGSDGTAKNTLALIANGNVANLSDNVDGVLQHNDSGAVYIRAPILLQDGNLFISATGDIHLIDNAKNGDTGADAWNKRAIIDIGSGIAWLHSAAGASVLQDANTAVIADQTAVWGGSVQLDSALNSTRVLAGRATNGHFKYVSTNASGTVDTTSTVTAPYTGDSMSEVRERQYRYLGSNDVVADATADPFNDPYREYTLSYGGEQFDAVVFEATRFVRPDGVDANGQTKWKPITDAEMLNYLDSSDYLVHGLTFTDNGGVTWTLKPDKTKPYLTEVSKDGQVVGSIPVGFAMNANGGTLAISDVDTGKTQYPNAGWGVIGWNIFGASNSAEVQHDQAADKTQQLVIGLPGSTDAVTATLGWLIIDQASWVNTVDGEPAVGPLYEAARAHYFKNVDTATPDIQTHQATIAAGVNDQSRSYGDANTAPSYKTEQLNAAAQAVREVDQFVDSQLGRSGITAGTPAHTATQASNVGSYAITNNYSADAFATRRYEIQKPNGKLTIVPVELTVHADSHVKNVGDADPTLSWQHTGGSLKNGDSLADALQGDVIRDPGEAPGNYAITQHDLRVKAADNTNSAGRLEGEGGFVFNYTLTFVNGNLQIIGPVAPPPEVKTPDVSANRATVAAQVPGSERCNALESPAAVSANYTATPAVARTYAVQLICKPRAYGSKDPEMPDVADVLSYANTLLKDGSFQVPDWNRSVIPHELINKARDEKAAQKNQ